MISPIPSVTAKDVIPNKHVGGRTYVHIDSLSCLDAERTIRVAEAERLVQVERRTDFNLVRLDDAGPCFALLNSVPFHLSKLAQWIDLHWVDAASCANRRFGRAKTRWQPGCRR